jgi:hypothetical protein
MAEQKTIWAGFVDYGKIYLGEIKVAKETAAMWKIEPGQHWKLTNCMRQITKSDARYRPTREEAVLHIKRQIAELKDRATEDLARALHMETAAETL